MNTYRPRSRRKSTFQKLFTSPRDQGIMDAPFIYMLLGAGFSLYAVIGLFTGEMDVGRYSENIIRYNDNPGFYLFCVITLFGLGIGLFLWGRRLWRRHED